MGPSEMPLNPKSELLEIVLVLVVVLEHRALRREGRLTFLQLFCAVSSFD
jgi:hypothetical protein